MVEATSSRLSASVTESRESRNLMYRVFQIPRTGNERRERFSVTVTITTGPFIRPMMDSGHGRITVNAGNSPPLGNDSTLQTSPRRLDFFKIVPGGQSNQLGKTQLEYAVSSGWSESNCRRSRIGGKARRFSPLAASETDRADHAPTFSRTHAGQP